MLPVLVLPAARRDQLSQAEYYDAQGGEAVGDRFLNRFEEAFARLAAFPESGTQVRYRHPRLEGCRFILVPEFDKILVFYRIAGGQLEILRILHGARDIDAAFGDERDETRH